jgi:cytochrome c
MKLRVITAVLALCAAPALAQDATGDAAAGEAAFRQCATCHHVVAADGTVLAGREQVKTGPNLYGVAGRAAASVEGFRYGDGIKAAGEKGLVWDEASFVKYVQDPGAFLKEYTGDGAARSNMSFKLRKEEDALNLYAYLASLATQ